MSENKCVLCRSATDDEVQLGEKYTSNGVTAHYYCLVSQIILICYLLFCLFRFE